MKEFNNSQDLETFFREISLVEKKEYYFKARKLLNMEKEGTAFAIERKACPSPVVLGVLYIPLEEPEARMIFHSVNFNFGLLRQKREELWKEFQGKFETLFREKVPKKLLEEKTILFFT